MAPSQEHIAQVFAHLGLGEYDTFFNEHVAPDVCK